MPDIEHTLLVGIVLLATVPFVVADAASSLRAGFDNAFWALPLDDRLDRIVDRRAAWRRLGVVWIFIIVLMAAGLRTGHTWVGSTRPVAVGELG